MEFFIFTGISIGIILINSLLGKYKNKVGGIVIISFLIWQFNLSDDYDNEIDKNLSLEQKKTHQKNEDYNLKSLNSYNDYIYLPKKNKTSNYSKSYQKNNYNNNSKTVRIRTGAICNDGTISTATGRGACSHHGGVAYWTYK